MTLANREIVLGVSGGIAAYKAADLCSKLVQQQAAVSVVLTESARQFIQPLTFQALTNRPVHTSLWDAPEHPLGEHIGLVDRADLLVVAPATAQTLARIASGMADDLLSTLALTRECPLILAPAMNSAMWEKAAVQRNMAQVRDDGAYIVSPGHGWLSCGRVGAGRMADVPEILAAIQHVLTAGRKE